MSKPIATVSPNHQATAQGSQLPPEERFWKRYSPHQELPISAASSLGLHVGTFGAALIIALAAVYFHWDDKNKPLAIETVATEIGGDGRLLGGDGNAQGDGAPPPAPQEAVTQTAPQPRTPTPVPIPEIQAPNTNDRTLPEVPRNDNVEQIVQDVQLSQEKLNKAGKRMQDAIRTGTGGAGRGDGDGSGDGPKRGGNITQREKRQRRWSMLFNTLGAHNYRKQLAALGAVIVIQQRDGRFLIYRDVMRPDKREVGALKGFGNQMYWVDDKPDSVDQLTRGLNVGFRADSFGAFFPPRLETQLLELEMTYFKKRHPNGTEEDIQTTDFNIRPGANGEYRPEVAGQTTKLDRK